MESVRPQPVDKVTNMPEGVIDDILVRLTTLEAAKISILWKEWRYICTTLPYLIFDNTLWKGSESPQDPNEFAESNRRSTIKFVLFLDQVLLHHKGPTTKLSFVVPELKSNSRINSLIDLLSDHGVEEFTFKLNDEYNLLSSLFMYSQLKFLKLDSCWINPLPLTFEGFNKLVTLELNSIVINDEVLEGLISSCPILKHLGPSQFEHFGIDARMLKFSVFDCDWNFWAPITICEHHSGL